MFVGIYRVLHIKDNFHRFIFALSFFEEKSYSTVGLDLVQECNKSKYEKKLQALVVYIVSFGTRFCNDRFHTNFANLLQQITNDARK